MNARMLTSLCLAAAIGVCASATTFAQDAMPASAGSAMSHDSMHKDMMKGSMHGHGTMMKKHAMQHGAMKHAAMHHGAMMEKGDSMKMNSTKMKKKAEGIPASSGG